MLKQRTHLQLPNGNYHGEVTGHEPVRHGVGKMIFTDGSYYEGQWMNDKRNGQGIFHFSSGNVYQGYFVNDKKEGYGEFYYAQSEEYYRGYWMNDKKHGLGEYFFRNGDKFHGFFVQDVKHGPGTKTSRNLRYEGVWENNKKEGSFEFVNLKTGKAGIIFYRANRKIGIQPGRASPAPDATPVGFGSRAGEETLGEGPSFSHYTHSYQSPSCHRQSSKKLSVSDVHAKPADFPGEVGRQNPPRPLGFGQSFGYALPHPPFPPQMEPRAEAFGQMPGAKPGTQDSLPEEPKGPMAKQLQSFPQIKENCSFRSYDSRSIKTTSQGTFNSSAKTNMMAFYDYKEFKEGVSDGKINLKPIEEDLAKRLGAEQGPSQSYMQSTPGLPIESLSMERHDRRPPFPGAMPPMHFRPDFDPRMQPQPPQFSHQSQGGYGVPGMYRPFHQGPDPRAGPRELAQIEERPELGFNNSGKQTQGSQAQFEGANKGMNMGGQGEFADPSKQRFQG